MRAYVHRQGDKQEERKVGGREGKENKGERGRPRGGGARSLNKVSVVVGACEGNTMGIA